MHHVLSRTLKDIVCRYKSMSGFYVPRKGGWDTHGLPVEIAVERELGISGKDQIETFGIAEFNRRCRESVLRYESDWRRLTERIGYWLDMDHAYYTFDNSYIETVWWLLRQYWDQGFLYQGHKIVPYCPRCGTPLSSHEVSLGYEEVTEPSVTVKFPLVDEPGAFVLAWTTTPWTLPGNVALAVGPDIAYVRARQKRGPNEERYYLAKERLPQLEGEYVIEKEFKGRELAGRRYRPLFDFIDLEKLTGKKGYYVCEADFVTTEDGTGVVHTAVMYGEDDYQLGLRLDLPQKHTVDPQGRFTAEVKPWAGRNVKEVEKDIIAWLKEHGLLYRAEMTTHSYPFCWRCDSPLLYYAWKTWYIATCWRRTAASSGTPGRSGRTASRTGSRTTWTGRSRETATGERPFRSGAARAAARTAASGAWPSSFKGRAPPSPWTFTGPTSTRSRSPARSAAAERAAFRR